MTDRSWIGQLASLALAVLLAVLVWLASSENERPMGNITSFPAPPAEGIPIELPQLPAGWSAYDLTPQTVRVGLRGLDDGLAQMTPSGFTARAVTEALPAREDSYTVPVEVECPACRRRGVRVTSVEPAALTLRVAPTVTRTLPVQVVAMDPLPAGYHMAASAVTPTLATVAGAGAVLARVDHVAAAVTSPEAVGEVQQLTGVPLQAVDVAGRAIPGARVIPASAAVTASLERQGLSVAIYPDLTGMNEVADGYVMGSFTTEPDVAELTGPAPLLGDIQSQGRVSTAPVDITGASGRLQKRVALLLPDGVTALNAPEGVTVTVEVEPLPGTATLDVPVAERGLGEGFEATITPARVRVLLSGPQPELERIQPADIAVYADATGLGPGIHRVRLRMDAPSGVRPRSITPEDVEMEIRAVGGQPTPRPAATSAR